MDMAKKLSKTAIDIWEIILTANLTEKVHINLFKVAINGQTDQATMANLHRGVEMGVAIGGLLMMKNETNTKDNI